MKNKLDCIIVGCAKCGTTYLMNVLRRHPRIEMCKDELHYFDNNYHIKNYYQKHFDFSNENKIFIEKSPSYCFIPMCMERIYKYNSDIKIILCVRNHIDRIISHIHMNINRGDEIRDIDRIINSELLDMNAKITYESSQYMYIRRTLYHGQIEKCFSIFPKENVFIFNIDNYNLLDLYKFIGVDLIYLSEKDIFKRVGSKHKEEDFREYILSHKKLMDLIRDDKQKVLRDFSLSV